MMATTRSKLPPEILDYIVMVERGEVRSCEEQKLLVKYIRKRFRDEAIYIDEKLLQDYMRLERYFPFQLFPWERFVFVLHNCAFREDGMPRWPDLFLYEGRGAGKDGYIGFESFALASPYNPIDNYDVDICANNEEQAMRPVKDVIAVLETREHTGRLRKHFRWTQEQITGCNTRSVIKGRTNNFKTKDGLRSGIVIFNEIHQYENYANIDVFTTGLGKKPHPRRTYATTDGNVRGGPLDDLLEQAQQILHGDIPDNGFLPFVCKLDKLEDVHDPANWEKANPSLPYLPHLRGQIQKEYLDWKKAPNRATAFMTKRMNFPSGDKETQVTEWKNVLATKRDVPDLEGHPCVAGVDYMKTTDFMAARLLFRVGDMRYSVGHAWINTNSVDIPRIKYDWRQACIDGLITPIDDVEIHPDILMEWFHAMGQRYDIRHIGMDDFRIALLKNSFASIGFQAMPRGGGNIKQVRPSDIMRIVPVIDSWFNNQQIAWGDDSFMRWCVSNTKLVQNRGVDKERGNFTYGKIEAKSRKNDGFMAFVHAACLDYILDDGIDPNAPDLGVLVF